MLYNCIQVNNKWTWNHNTDSLISLSYQHSLVTKSVPGILLVRGLFKEKIVSTIANILVK